MNTNKRRCYSEQVPLHTKRVVPPHKAAKLRQAQLYNTHEHLLTHLDSCRSIRIETSHKDEKEVVPQSRNSSAPVQLHQQDRRTSDLLLNSLPSHPCQRFPRHERQPERTNTQFPSIDAVIAEPKDRDTRRKLGETDFYECTGDDGVVRRRSMMRMVDKDDLLVARGANPRTGLITPDWNSVASSLDNNHTHAARRDRPSAQWKLDGDAWISVPPEDDPLDRDVETSADMENSKVLAMHASTAQTSRDVTGTRPTAALTEQNLRTFSDQIQPGPTLSRELAQKGEEIQENQIRRKPVGSQGVLSTSKGIQGRPTRNVSGDTVIHSPDALKGSVPEHLATFPYFSPDSVGRGLSRSDATNFPQRNRNDTPFLGLPVESRGTILPPPRGFTSKTTSQNQLQRSLRTSSGPYPSHLSSQPPMLIKASQSLHTLQDQRIQYRQGIDASRGQRGPHQPVQKAYLPDAMTSSSHAQLRSQLHDHPEWGLQTRKAQPRHGGRPVIILEEDHRSPDSSNHLHTQRVLGATQMNTQMSGFISQRQPINDMPPQQHNPTLPRHVTYSHQDRIPGVSIKNMSDMVVDHNVISPRLGHGDVEPVSGRRPQLGSRAQEMLYIPKIREEIGTVLKAQSNTTGMDAAPIDEEDEDNTAEELTEDLEVTTSKMSNNLESSCPTVHFRELPGTNSDDARKSKDQSHTVTRKHSVCCPECCTEFDCHDSCLGHPNPNVSVVDSETSSLASMGIFDANFETSVKAVNMTLLTPSGKSDGKLAKIRTALGWKSGANSPTQSPPRVTLTKRTLRDEPLSQKVNIGLIRHPQQTDHGTRDIDTKQAKAAAIKAQGIADYSQKTPRGHDRAQNRDMSKGHTKRKTKEYKNEKVNTPPEANKGRRISEKVCKASQDEALEPKTPMSNFLEPVLTQSQSRNEATVKDEPTGHTKASDEEDQSQSMLSRVSMFIRENPCLSRPKCVDLSVLANPVLLSYLRSLPIAIKDMTVTVADTSSVIVEVALEYNRSGNVVLPAGTNASEIAGNILRSVLYLMITAYVYALCAKAGSMCLAFLRIVLLPVRICAWIIG